MPDTADHGDKKTGLFLDFVLDVVLASYTGEREVRVRLPEEEPVVRIKKVLEEMHVPPGMVGYIVSNGKLFKLEDTITAPCTVRMFGIYDGG